MRRSSHGQIKLFGAVMIEPSPTVHEVFDYTLVSALPPGLSDHSPLLIQFHDTPKPPPCFQFYDMWSSHQDFLTIISTNLPSLNSPAIMKFARSYFATLRRQLGKLNRNNFTDLKGQQESALNALAQAQQNLEASPDNTSFETME